MMDETCMYCAQNEELDKLMTHVCDLPHTRVYLYRENTFPGRCVVVWKEHIWKITQLSRQEQHDLTDDVCRVAEAVTRLYRPDKINYLILGDRCPHLHVHVVPKYADSPEWGKMFEMMPFPSRFMDSEEAYQAAAELLRRELLHE